MKKILLFVAAAMVAMSASAANFLAGTLPGLTWAADGYPINGTAVFEDVPAGTYEFKVTNGTWTDALGTGAVDASQSTPGYNPSADNVTFTIKSAATITITTDGTSIILKSTVPFGNVEITSYTIVGDELLLGVNWDTNAEENNMTQDGSQWVLEKKGVELTAGDYGYKVVGNHSYSVYQNPQQGNNTLTIDADGTYDLTFTLIVGEGYLEAVATLVSEGGEEGGEEGGDEPIVTPTGADYYLIGWINGADYGDKEDFANLGDYKFVDGTLVATFTADSYVAIKNGDMTKWYFAEAYAGASPVTLEAGKDFGEKLFVPGGVEVTFTLVENADGSLTLSYTTGTTTGIEDVDAEDAVVAAYDLLGRPVAADAAGYVILQYASGKAAKVFNY